MNAPHSAAKTHALQLIDDAIEAYKLCEQTAAYLVDQGGPLAEPHLVRIVRDACEINQAAAAFTSRASAFHRDVLELAAAVSDRCAEALEAVEADHDQIRATRAACARAATASRELLDPSSVPRSSRQEDQRDEALKETFPGSDTVPPPTEL